MQLDLPTILAYVVAGGVGGAALAILLERWEKFKNWLPSWKKAWTVFLVCVLLPPLGWLASIGMGYISVPAIWQGWIESIVKELAIGFVAWGGSQIMHKWDVKTELEKMALLVELAKPVAEKPTPSKK